MRRHLLILVVISSSILVGSGIGAYVMHRIIMREFAMSELTNDLSILGYLESDRLEDANRFLRRQVEVQIATIERSGQFDLDENRRDSRDKWIERYARISKSYPPMDHEYDPEIRKIVDNALDRVRGGNQ